MKRSLLFLVILILLPMSCSVKKKMTTQTKVDSEVVTETKKKEIYTDIKIPKSNIFLSDRIVANPSGEIKPISRIIVDPVTKQTLKLNVSKDGEINVSSITNSDTLKISKVDTYDKSNIKTESETQITTEFLGAFHMGSMIGYIILGLILIVFFIFIKRLITKKI
jgi:hypothetical protein